MKKIIINDEYVALLIKNIETTERIHFYTEAEDQFQIAAFSMHQGQKIQPHLHLDQVRKIEGTHEILYVQSGELLVNFYADKNKEEIYTTEKLQSGDLIYFRSGIHGFEIGEDCKFLEFKQGPFIDGKDKIKLY